MIIEHEIVHGHVAQEIQDNNVEIPTVQLPIDKRTGEGWTSCLKYNSRLGDQIIEICKRGRPSL